MFSRMPHTIPYSSYALPEKDEADKIREIKKHIPLNEELIQYIVEEEPFELPGDESEEIRDVRDTVPVDTEETSVEGLRKTESGSKSSIEKEGRLTQILKNTAKKEDSEEITKEPVRRRPRRIVPLPDEISDEELEEETDVEIPLYDIVGRGVELREQEKENEKYLQELDNKAVFMEFRCKEKKKELDRVIKNFLQDKIGFDYEDIDDFREEFEAILKEENISSLVLDDEDGGD